MAHAARLGHPDGGLPAADILAALCCAVLRIDPRNPSAPDRDRLILSKGHCSAAPYATLAESGFFPRERLAEHMKPLPIFNGHPDRNKVAGVEANIGPLGHGLPIAVGAAWLAGLATGYWKSLEALERLPRDSVRFEPRMTESRRADLTGGWKEALRRTISARPPGAEPS